LAQICHVIFEKNASLISKNDVTEPKGRKLGYSIYQLKSCSQVKGSSCRYREKRTFNSKTWRHRSEG